MHPPHPPKHLLEEAILDDVQHTLVLTEDQCLVLADSWHHTLPTHTNTTVMKQLPTVEEKRWLCVTSLCSARTCSSHQAFITCSANSWVGPGNMTSYVL